MRVLPILLASMLIVAACGGAQPPVPTPEPTQQPPQATATLVSTAEPKAVEEPVLTQEPSPESEEAAPAVAAEAPARHVLTAVSDDGNLELSFLAPVDLQRVNDAGSQFALADGSASLEVRFYPTGTETADAIAAASDGAAEIQQTPMGELGAIEGDTKNVLYVPGSLENAVYVLVISLDKDVHQDEALSELLAPIALSVSSGPSVPPQVLRMVAPELVVVPTPITPLDVVSLLDAVAELTPERVAELDELVIEATIPQLQAAFEVGTLSAEELVTYYVNRILTYSVNGLNAVIELNPEALDLARALDQERAQGAVRGPMHGIPVLLKANIATGDLMHTTAGAYALKDWQADRDAFLVQQLRAAGAVILGKANLSEWANWMDPSMPNGFSALGGQTADPYGPFDPLGSSTGSAVAPSANLVTVAVGTETTGSIVQPASANSVVGLKTSRGLVSRDYVIPLVDWLDTPGPMGRTVTDVAVLLSAMTGVDENDPTTQDAAELAGTDTFAALSTGFTQFLDLERAQELRVGLVVTTDADVEATLASMQDLDLPPEQLEGLKAQLQAPNQVMRAIGQVFQEAGIETVEVGSGQLPPNPPLVEIITYGFKDSLNRWLAGLGDQAPVSDLAEVIAINNQDPAVRAPFGQGYLEQSQNTTMTADEYQAMVDEALKASADGLRRVLADNDVDVLVINNTTQAYAAAGFPALSVPLGYAEDGQPLGMILSGDYLSEPQLLAAGYAFEQATKARQAPDVGARVTALQVAAQAAQQAAMTPVQQADLQAMVAGFSMEAVFGEAAPTSLEELADLALDSLVYQPGDEDTGIAPVKAPGAIVLTEAPEGRLLKVRGLSRVEDQTPMTVDDRMEIGSNSKMFTALLLTQLAEEGVLSLDDSLSRWLPVVAQQVPNGQEITLRQLANHTSGVCDYGDPIIGGGVGVRPLLTKSYHPEELVAWAIENCQPDFAPGEEGQWKYSNTGYVLLGMALEAATGQSYETLLQERIFQPLGMRDTYLLTGVPEPGSIANGYLAYPFDVNTTDWNGTQGWAAGAIVSTATDLAKFANAFMKGQLFQDPATLQVMQNWVGTTSAGGLGYGIGLIEMLPGVWGHRGQTAGFTSIIAMDPEEDFIFIALTNAAEGGVSSEQGFIGRFLNLEPSP